MNLSSHPYRTQALKCKNPLNKTPWILQGTCREWVLATHNESHRMHREAKHLAQRLKEASKGNAELDKELEFQRKK